jgi:hypothetical protein
VDSATEAARAEVLASREAFGAELVRLEEAARASVDIKAKIQRNPVRTVGLVAGTGFLAVRGPRRVARGVRRVVRGKSDPLPPSLLPAEVERAIKALGDDGQKVRGTLERDFADYLEKRNPKKRGSRTKGLGTIVAQSMIAPLVQVTGKRLAGQLGRLEDQEFRKAFDGFLHDRAASPPAGGESAGNQSSPAKDR